MEIDFKRKNLPFLYIVDSSNLDYALILCLSINRNKYHDYRRDLFKRYTGLIQIWNLIQSTSTLKCIRSPLACTASSFSSVTNSFRTNKEFRNSGRLSESFV